MRYLFFFFFFIDFISGFLYFFFFFQLRVSEIYLIFSDWFFFCHFSLFHFLMIFIFVIFIIDFHYWLFQSLWFLFFLLFISSSLFSIFFYFLQEYSIIDIFIDLPARLSADGFIFWLYEAFIDIFGASSISVFRDFFSFSSFSDELLYFDFFLFWRFQQRGFLFFEVSSVYFLRFPFEAFRFFFLAFQRVLLCLSDAVFDIDIDYWVFFFIDVTFDWGHFEFLRFSIYLYFHFDFESSFEVSLSFSFSSSFPMIFFHWFFHFHSSSDSLPRFIFLRYFSSEAFHVLEIFSFSWYSSMNDEIFLSGRGERDLYRESFFREPFLWELRIWSSFQASFFFFIRAEIDEYFQL